MKKCAVILLLPILFSCSQKYYVYKIRMQKPETSERLNFENDTFSISFQFKPKFIEFDMYNKSNEGIRINWDEVSMSVNGKAKRIVHNETGISKITEVQPPTTIPPQTKLKDAIIITDYVSFKKIMGETTMILKDVYPTTDYGNKKVRDKILNFKGQRATVYFPYYIRNQFYSMTFEFLIYDILSSKSSKNL